MGSAKATERERAATKRRYQLEVARANLATCRRELVTPSEGLAYVTRSTWLHLEDVWLGWVNRLAPAEQGGRS